MKNHNDYRTFKVYIPEHGETADDEGVFEARETENWIELVVQQFLKHCYDNCDGWDWMKNSEGSLVIAVDDDLGNKWSFTYSLDWEPSFGVYEVVKS